MFLFLDCFKCGTAHHDDFEKFVQRIFGFISSNNGIITCLAVQKIKVL